MVPRSCDGYREAARDEDMLWDIFFSGKLTSADFSPSLLNTPFGLGWESLLQSLSIEQ